MKTQTFLVKIALDDNDEPINPNDVLQVVSEQLKSTATVEELLV